MGDDLKTRVGRTIDELGSALIETSDAIYRQPELGLQEVRAAARLSRLLEEHGLAVERGIGGLETSFLARKDGRRPGPKVAILAEYDALPEIGHGCGHNLIGTAAVGAGVAVASVIGELPGAVMVVGCPAEEGAVDNAGGKVVLVDKGFFIDVDAAMMVHPANRTAVEGTSTSREAMEISFRGRAAHAAGAPHEGINALEAAILTFNGINALRQHLKDDVRIHGVLTKGGVAPNIVPDYSEIRLYVRANDPAYLTQTVEKVKNCARGAAMATGASVAFRKTANTYEGMRTNLALAGALQANLEALGRKVEKPDRPGSGSTDMGNVSQVVPAVHAYLGICGKAIVGHSREFAEATLTDEAHRALIDGAKALAMTVVDLLNDPALMKRVKDEFATGRSVAGGR
ncbi:MAG TPA: M20 family metallopeptidase [Bacillota bacterium]